ncbi:hypothetical protein E1263_25335 [Kribbella antibiotica]|uniref:Uncharacterized protein n=1 Tax=Kribbella antibiotica TaxID=190195 RepID=A0A4R4ZDI9_9ACTN|nr:hypothetical protein [Kribbella antibiotica]TDD56365.1 hypothetical protein E1263_25335 [Kribbella antibiotica]
MRQVDPATGALRDGNIWNIARIKTKSVKTDLTRGHGVSLIKAKPAPLDLASQKSPPKRSRHQVPLILIEYMTLMVEEKRNI